MAFSQYMLYLSLCIVSLLLKVDNIFAGLRKLTVVLPLIACNWAKKLG